jgi:7-cyano-7-deazaguanine synthase
VIKIDSNKQKVVLILSGGMDSTTLLYDLLAENKEVYTLSFDYGQKHMKELEYASKTCEKLNVNHKILQLDVLNEVAPSALTRDQWEVPEGHYTEESMKQTVVPNRNMVMLSLATAYAISNGATKVYYGAHAGDHAIYPDCRKEFVEAMQKVILLCDWTKVELIAPYLDLDKGDIAIKGMELGVDYSLTWSCYKGNAKACGKCGSCTERLEAFKKAGMKDPIEYED